MNTSFKELIRTELRRKPTTILIGEARDKEAIQASVDAALKGRFTFTSTKK